MSKEEIKDWILPAIKKQLPPKKSEKKSNLNSEKIIGSPLLDSPPSVQEIPNDGQVKIVGVEKGSIIIEKFEPVRYTIDKNHPNFDEYLELLFKRNS